MKSTYKVEDVGIHGCLEDGQIVLTINPLEIGETGKNIDEVYKELMAFYQFNAQKNMPLTNTQKKRPQKSKVVEVAEIVEVAEAVENMKEVSATNLGDKILEEGSYKGQTFNNAYKKDPEAIVYLSKRAKSENVQNEAIRFLEEMGK